MRFVVYQTLPPEAIGVRGAAPPSRLLKKG
jgi:hypothetical protein